MAKQTDMLKNKYSLVINGEIVRTSEKIKFLRGEFYLALGQGKKVWIEKEGQKIGFNGVKVKR